MSNIQITENASGKYSPEWFYSESQTPEWISFAHKADELRENFINLFGIERLKSLSGKDLLTSLFYNDEGTKTNTFKFDSFLGTSIIFTTSFTITSGSFCSLFSRCEPKPESISPLSLT